MTVSESTVEAVAARLRRARCAGAPIPPIRSLLPKSDITAAYAVQQCNTRRRLAQGKRLVGRKIGLTSKAVQAQLGVDQPDFGTLFDDMAHYGDDVTLPLRGLIAPRIEAEFAFILGADITERRLERDALAAAVEGVAASAEIVDSAIAGWDIDIVDTVADNASAGAFALGTAQPYSAALVLPARTMRLWREGVVVSEGNGAATLGDPLNALAWLADMAVEVGAPLRAGEVILSGALGPMQAFAAGSYRIEIDGFPTLTVRAA